DQRASHLVAELGKGQHCRYHAGWDCVMAARVHRLDRPVGTEDRDGVVQSYEPDRTPGPCAPESRAEGCRHSGDAAFDLELGFLEQITEIPRTLVLLVGQLGVLVHEAVRFERDTSGRLDRRQDPLVVHDYLLDRWNRERQKAPSTSLRPPTVAACWWAWEVADPAGAADSFVAMHWANCSVSFPATSATTPRPYWATAPLRARSVATSTCVPPSRAVSRDSIVASALPRPFDSRALTASTT